jgi:LemA protein
MKFNKGTVIVVVVVFAVIVMAIVGINHVPANAIAYEEKVTEAFSDIKVQEKRRADLLPTLADAIKAYDKHEYQTLMDVINARKASDGTISDEAVNEINDIINVVLENYPDLKSQDNYKEFMKESSITENKIAETRQAYNKAVSRYNTYTRHPINKFFLSLTGYEIIEYQKLSYNVSEDVPMHLFE